MTRPRSSGLKWVRLLPSFSVGLFMVVTSTGGFVRGNPINAREIVSAAFLLLSAAFVVVRRTRNARRTRKDSIREEWELGANFVALAFILVRLTGEATWPLVYLLSVTCGALFSSYALMAVIAAVAVLDMQVTLTGQPALYAVHCALIAFFGYLPRIVFKAARPIERLSGAEASYPADPAYVEAAGREVSAEQHGDESSLFASVREVEGTIGGALEIADQALRTHTCAVYLLNSEGTELLLYGCRSQSPKSQHERVSAAEGALGAALKRQASIRVSAQGGVKGVTYYINAVPQPSALCLTPIVDKSGTARGLLIADRVEFSPFDERDERLLESIAREVSRALEADRVMAYIRKNRDEKERFFRAIEELNRAGSSDPVFLAVLESARQLAPLDFGAVTVVQEEGGQKLHRIVRTFGVSAPGATLEGRTFPDNHGLVANVVRYGAALPGRDAGVMDRQMIFDADSPIRNLQSLKIFPLVAGNRILGTLVAASRTPGAIDADACRMLEVMAIQAAQAVLRAQLFEQMERMATIDGLTGLLNRRTFNERFDEALASARRYGRKCSVILTDVDHFKKVNDTWGHSTGDAVLKGVARALKEKARDTDIVARYGGEEFAIIMPETDAKGAWVIAERIREAVMAQIHATDQQPLKVTLSLGIATFPDSTSDKQSLVDLADQCLYFAKRNGRNQSVTVAQMQAGKRMVS